MKPQLLKYLLCFFVLIASFLPKIHAQNLTEVYTNQEPLELDLDTALELAFENNRDIQRSVLDVQSSTIAVDNAERQFHPSLSMSSSASSEWSDSGIDSSWSDPSESASMRLSSSYTAFDGFSRSADLASSRASLESTELTGSRTMETVIYQVVRQFLDTVAAKAQIHVQEENLLAQQKLLQKIEAYYSTGKIPVADLYQQQAELASAEYNLISVTHNFELSKLTLAEKIGITPNNSIVIKSDSDSEITSRFDIPENPELALSLAKSNRSDYAARQADILSAEKNIRAAEGGFWPSVSMSLDTGTSYRNAGSGSFMDQFSDNPYASLGVSINLPIYNRNKTKNDVAGAKLAHHKVELARLDLDQQIANEILTAYLELKTALKQLVSAESQKVYAIQALENYEQRYSVNSSTLLEVIQSRARYLDAEFDKINSESNLMKKQVAIAYYLGNIRALLKDQDAMAAIQ